MDQKREFLFKVIVIGELATGKTALVKRYVHKSFSEHKRIPIPFGVDFALKIVKYDDDTVIRLQLWDTAGQERFATISRVYYEEAVGCFIVFDVTRGSTFEAVLQWKTMLDREIRLPNGDPIPCILLANKCDLVRADSKYNPERLNDFCREQGFAKWFQTSAKENTNVQESFQFLVDEIMKLPEESLPDPIKSTSNNRKINATEKPVSERNNNRSCYGGSSSS